MIATGAALAARTAAGLATVVALLAAPGPRGASGLDWGRRAVLARGQGAPDLDAPSIAVARLGAERAARADALRRLLAAVEAAPVVGGGTAAERLQADAALRAKVEDALRSFAVVKSHYFSDGGVVLDVEVSLDRLPPELLRALLRPSARLR